MNNETWTPEPWQVAQNEANLKTAPWSGAVGIETPYEGLAVPPIVCWTTRSGEAVANARRIVACVNYCEGFKTSYLENHTTEQQREDAWNERETRREQIDALAEALRIVIEQLSPSQSVPIVIQPNSEVFAITNARAALAKLGEKT